MPVELLYFDAKPTRAGEIILSWATASEFDCKGYEIIRKNQNNVEEVITWQDGFGTTYQIMQYAFTDKTVKLGESYVYMLKQYDINKPGKIIANKFIKLDVSALSISEIYPNPAENEAFLSIDSFNLLSAQIEILDATGKLVVSEKKTTINRGLNRLSLPINTIKPGIYNVLVTINNHTVSRTFVKS